jgi:isocitrate dehydrogenase (NAD+)
VEGKLAGAISAVKRNGVALKGHLETPLGTGSRLSLNLALRKSLGLFANVVACKTLPGVPARHNDVDLIVIRQNTEGEYSTEEHEILPGVVESLKVTTREKCIEIAKFAFDYAVRNKRNKVTCVHKANIMKRGDGLFLESCKEVSALYPNITYNSLIVDNTSMQLVSKPKQFDVLVTPNLYGNIVENIAAGLVGGPGVIPGIDIGTKYAIFEPGTRSSQVEEAGKNTVNPAAMILSAANMLDHIQLPEHGALLRDAVYKAIASGTKTADIGGRASTTEFTQAVIKAAQNAAK